MGATVVEAFAGVVVAIGMSVLFPRGIAVGSKKGDSVEGEFVLTMGDNDVVGAMVVGVLVAVVTVDMGACVGVLCR